MVTGNIKIRYDDDNKLVATDSPLPVLTSTIKDTASNAEVCIDYPHHEIHEGDSYFVTYTGVLNTGLDYELRIQTPSGYPYAHMIASIDGTGQTDYRLYEGTSKTHVSGNALVPTNRDRNSNNTSTLTICHTPGLAASGTLLGSAIFGVDSGTGVNRVLSGGSESTRSEIILRNNTAYLLQAHSGTTGNRITMVLDWYENSII